MPPPWLGRLTEPSLPPPHPPADISSGGSRSLALPGPDVSSGLSVWVMCILAAALLDSEAAPHVSGAHLQARRPMSKPGAPTPYGCQQAWPPFPRLCGDQRVGGCGEAGLWSAGSIWGLGVGTWAAQGTCLLRGRWERTLGCEQAWSPPAPHHFSPTGYFQKAEAVPEPPTWACPRPSGSAGTVFLGPGS